MFRFFKDLLLTGFTLGFRFRVAGGWGRLSPSLGDIADTIKGVLAVWLIVFFILKGIESYIEIHIGKRFSVDSSPWELAAFLALNCVIYYVLVTRGHGIKFEREFDKLKKSRKILLIVGYATLLLATLVFAGYSRSAYQRFFHS